MECKRCNERKTYCKSMCMRCYYATKKGYKTYKEQLLERNYVHNREGVLTDKKGNKWFIDLEDFEKVKNIFWTDNGSGYARHPKVGYLHRVLFPEYKLVDHIDRNPGNNHKCNLRDGAVLNCINKISKLSKTGERGICLLRNTFQVRMNFNKIRYYIGTFKTLNEAILRRDLFLEKKGDN